MSDVLDDFAAAQAPAAKPAGGGGGGASMTMGADGIPRISISGTSADEPKAAPAPVDPLDAFAGAQPVAPKAAPASSSSGAETIPSRLLRSAREVVDPIGTALGTDYGKNALGVASGFADLGNTLIGRMKEAIPAAKPGAFIQPPSATQASPITGQTEAERRAGLEAFNKEQSAGPGGGSFDLGRIEGNIAATAPLSTGLSGAVPTALGLGASRAAPVVTQIPGVLQKAASLPYLGPVVRQLPGMVDAAVNAGVTTAAVDPEHAGTAAGIGFVTPPIIGAATKTGGAVANLYRSMMQGNASRDAASILRAGGMSPEDIPAVLAKLGRATDEAGVPLAPHQILFDPARPETAGFSQLARNLRNAGQTGLVGIEDAQRTARQGILDKLSPNTGTVADAAADFGNYAQPTIAMKNAEALQRVKDAFGAVDPENATRLHLPLNEMEAALRDKFPNAELGAKGAPTAHGLLNLFRSIGETPVDFAASQAGKVTQTESTLAQAVRRAGGINAGNESGRAFGGELAALNETTSGLVNKGRGQDVDKLAERLHAAGFLPDSDPATLIQALHYEGKTRLSNEANMEALYNKAREAAQQGDMPTGRVAIPNELPFAQVQQVRSMLAEAARKIENGPTGATAESTALRAMKRQLDAHVAAVAEGQGAAAEHFPADVADRYYAAIGKKVEQANNFTKGPQAVALRPNADLTSGQLAGKFYNATGGQGGAMEYFGRVEDPAMRNLLRGYAVAGMRNTGNAAGDLTSKLGNFNDARSVANRALFTPEELQTLDNLAAGINKSTAADMANMGRNSATAQNLKTMLDQGIWGSPGMQVAGHLPVIGKPVSLLSGIAGGLTKQPRLNRLGSLMSDPQALSEAMQALQRAQPAAATGLGVDVTPQLLRVAPRLLLGGGG